MPEKTFPQDNFVVKLAVNVNFVLDRAYHSRLRFNRKYIWMINRLAVVVPAGTMLAILSVEAPSH